MRFTRQKEYCILLLPSTRFQWLSSLISRLRVSPYLRLRVSPYLLQNSLFGPNPIPRVHPPLSSNFHLHTSLENLLFRHLSRGFFVLCSGSLRAFFESHFVIFRYEVPWAWRCRRWRHFWAPCTSYRPQISHWFRFGNNSFLIITSRCMISSP